MYFFFQFTNIISLTINMLKQNHEAGLQLLGQCHHFPKFQALRSFFFNHCSKYVCQKTSLKCCIFSLYSCFVIFPLSLTSFQFAFLFSLNSDDGHKGNWTSRKFVFHSFMLEVSHTTVNKQAPWWPALGCKCCGSSVISLVFSHACYLRRKWTSVQKWLLVQGREWKQQWHRRQLAMF